MFNEESLERIRGEEQDTRVGEIHTYTDRNPIANNRALLVTFKSPLKEEATKYNRPVDTNKCRTDRETFDGIDFPKMEQEKAWNSGNTVEK